MMKPAAQRRFARSILDFLRWRPEDRGTAVVATAALALFGLACGGNLSKSPDAASCANVGCALPPLCGTGCQAPCGCCPCAPGSREGDLLCTDRGCYVSSPALDSGTDGGWAPATVCALAFDPGPCRGAIPVYAFVAGSCVQKVYGGCEGNDNRFASFEECMGTCVGPPTPGACPPNRVDREICFACGPAGGCAKKGTVCALVCDSAADASVCEPALPTCYQGVCQVTGCI
jgi:trypsin inhibitor